MPISNSRKNQVIVVGIVIVLFYTVIILFSDAQQFAYHWEKINFSYVPLILGLHLASILIRGVRQRLFLDSLGMRISLKNNIILYLAGLSMSVTPAGSGGLIKAHFLNKNYGQPYAKTMPIILTEKYCDILSVISVLCVILLFRNLLESQMIVVVISIFLLVIFLIVKNRSIFETVLPKIPKVWFVKTLLENATSFHDTLCILLKKKTILLGWAIGIVTMLIDAFAIYLVFLAFGLDYGFIDSTLLTYTAIVVGSVSFLPAGIGVTEVSMVGLLIKSGITLPIASALSIFIRLTTLWFPTIIGSIVLKFMIMKNDANSK